MVDPVLRADILSLVHCAQFSEFDETKAIKVTGARSVVKGSKPSLFGRVRKNIKTNDLKIGSLP
jgi:hypothetical protein